MSQTSASSASSEPRDWERWLATARDWVHAVERAYVAAAFAPAASAASAAADAATPTASAAPASFAAAPGSADASSSAPAPRSGAAPSSAAAPSDLALAAAAAAGAVASRFLAIGTPRSIGLVGDPTAAALSLAAHRVWFQPADLRCAGAASPFAGQLGGRAVSLDEALAADIVCIHAPLSLTAAQLRRGTHVNALAAGITFDDELRALATIADEASALPALAAGLRDGRQLDELTLFVAGDLAIARRALATLR